MKTIPFDHTQFASAELIIAYDTEEAPILPSDTDQFPRYLAGITIFLEPKDPTQHFHQDELIPAESTTVQITPDTVIINNMLFPNPNDLDQLTALLWENLPQTKHN